MTSLANCLVASAAGAVLVAQSAEVTSLQVRVAAKSVPISVVTIESRASVPIGAWRLELVGPDDKLSTTTIPATSTSEMFREVDPTTCSLQPGERCRIHLIGENGAVVRSVRLKYVRTVQGDLEGDQSVLDDLERERLAALATNEYWMSALENAPSEAAALELFLAGRVDEGLKRGFSADTFTGAWLDGAFYGCSPDHLLKTVRERQQELAVAHRFLQIPPRQQTPGPVTSATATLEAPETADEVVAYVTNVRDIAAEAWDFAIFGLPEARYPIKAFTSRGGGDPRAGAGLGPLGPHETRELLVMSPSTDEGVVTQPRVALRMAIFEDGRGEGPVELRQQMLADRARDAIDVEYWRLALIGVRGMSVQDAIKGLRDRLRTRKCEATGFLHADRSAPVIAALTAKIQRAQDHKTELIDKQIAALELERQAIAKFVNR